MTGFDLDAALRALGITTGMQRACRMPFFPDATRLVDAGPDMFGRPQQMTPETRQAWQEMQTAAAGEGIRLLLVSAYRSFEYQCEVIRRKLDEGRSLEDILQVNAIPGHSEHHSGRALDLHAGNEEPLTLAFEQHPAFDWLSQHASAFGFRLSFPRNNPAGIAYEPWHWCYHPSAGQPGSH